MRKVFLDNLPHNKSLIDWERSVGYTIEGVYDDIKFKYTIVKYEKKTHKVILKDLNENIINITTSNLKRCAVGKVLGKKTKDFKIEIGTIFKDSKRDIVIVDREVRKEDVKFKNRKNKTYTVNKKYYKYHCNKDGYESWILESLLLNNNFGCACCSGHVVIQGINDVATTDPWMIPIIGEEIAKTYSHGSNTKIKVCCPYCGRIKDNMVMINKIYQDKKLPCICNDKISYPNKLAFHILEQLEINFISEFSPEWISSSRYDFYFKLNNKEYILEMDGGWHNKDNNMSGKTKEESKETDDYKDEQAKLHNIKVIRIDCKKSELEYIQQNILNSKLNELFDLNNINWMRAEEFALSNLVKVACEYKKNKPELTTTEIGRIMKLSQPTIINWLKKGTLLGWCKYEAIKERAKICTKNGKSNNKKVEVFRDEKSLGIFQSATELEKKSEKLFGVKLINQGISASCNKNILYKGFLFAHV